MIPDPRRPAPYPDRAAAGRALAVTLIEEAVAVDDPVLLALPRGGVPVAAAMQPLLDADLDVLLVRKVGAPRQPELGIGAVGEDGVLLLDDELVRHTGATVEQVRATVARERDELARRGAVYRDDRGPADVEGRDVVVVDDGVATGVSARAALQVVRAREPRRLVLAVPVGSRSSLAQLEQHADTVVCPLVPRRFRAVGQWYEDFAQVSDREVVAALDAVA